MIDRKATPFGRYIGFAVGSAGTGAYIVLPGILLMFYLTNTLGVPVGLATMVVTLPRVLDFVSDPIMGQISDRTRSRIGPRRPYLLGGGAALLVSLPFLFAAPEYEARFQSALHVVAVYALCTLAFTVFQIPYTALLGEVTDSYHERTTFTMYRMMFLTVGMLVGGGVAPMIVQWAGGGPPGYATMSLIMGVYCGVLMLAAFFFIGQSKESRQRNPEPILAMLSDLLGNRPFVSLQVTYILQLAAMGCISASLPYYVVYVLAGGEQWVFAIFAAFNLAGLLGMPVWTIIARRIGKLSTFLVSAGLLVPGFGLTYIVHADYPPALFLFQVALNGFAFGGQQLASFSMLADTMASPRDGGFDRPRATMSGFFIAGEKVGMAAGIFFVGLMLGVAGLKETTEGAVEQSTATVTAIRSAYAIMPSVLILLSFLSIRFYREFDRRQLSELAREVP